MKINYKKVNEANAETVVNNGVLAVVLPAVEGFQKIVAYFCTSNGEYKWIHKDFQYLPRRKKKKKAE